MVAEQHVKLFLLLCVENAQAYILIDFIEMVFRPNIVHNLHTLDKTDGNNNKDVTATTTESNNDELSGTMFHRKPSVIVISDSPKSESPFILALEGVTLFIHD